MSLQSKIETKLSEALKAQDKKTKNQHQKFTNIFFLGESASGNIPVTPISGCWEYMVLLRHARRPEPMQGPCCTGTLERVVPPIRYCVKAGMTASSDRDLMSH